MSDQSAVLITQNRLPSGPIRTTKSASSGEILLDACIVKCLQALDLSKLLIFVCRPEIEVGAVRLVELEPWPAAWPAALPRQEKVLVASALIPQSLAPEESRSASVRYLEDDCSDAHQEPTVREAPEDALSCRCGPCWGMGQSRMYRLQYTGGLFACWSNSARGQLTLSAR